MIGPNELQFFVKRFVFSSISLEKIHGNGSKFFLFSNKINIYKKIYHVTTKSSGTKEIY